MDGRDDIKIEEVAVVPCNACKHALGVGQILKCAAFPDGIPAAIRYGENQHREPMDGQKNDLVYEERSE